MQDSINGEVRTLKDRLSGRLAYPIPIQMIGAEEIICKSIRKLVASGGSNLSCPKEDTLIKARQTHDATNVNDFVNFFVFFEVQSPVCHDKGQIRVKHYMNHWVT
ncbi:uncharacterized protein LACBIDRAFT_334766 [Laccaria bicolor S238N-H82]|uniref:Predicted protein n=1 Tax=Laccaria bicolor (strain S238N-H82 / ATCC MYA-4686) TaxID=486041 RepID=B0E084_LACBS|nr:uncharacterized protein LACBIDRAFT_334766 [Laccaria bicolor S238N-H82]EDQ99740.1 predicted protein [Laccaria bicolor S238N-H82]|eukprot:XP_001889576.1 predicted protein [Laccaria bicolor S238N-H82]